MNSAEESQLADIAQGPRIEKVRHELKGRVLHVEKTEYVTPGMKRIHLHGEDLADFASLGADDHIKIVVPTESGERQMRTYTPRRYSAHERTMLIDFAIHEAGPATRWALDAKPGDTLEVRGPKGSSYIVSEIEHWVLVGDETALPAIGRYIEEAAEGTKITAIVTVAGPDEHQSFETKADLTTHWIHRPLTEGDKADYLLEGLKALTLTPETYVWIAAETTIVKTLRRHLVEEQGHAKKWLKAAGYWSAGKADGHASFD